MWTLLAHTLLPGCQSMSIDGRLLPNSDEGRYRPDSWETKSAFHYRLFFFFLWVLPLQPFISRPVASLFGSHSPGRTPTWRSARAEGWRGRESNRGDEWKKGRKDQRKGWIKETAEELRSRALAETAVSFREKNRSKPGDEKRDEQRRG